MSFVPPAPALPLESSSQVYPAIRENLKPLESNLEEDKCVADTLQCWLEKVHDRAECYVASWKTPPTILQQGPQCGLVALSMAAQMLGHNVHPSSLLQLGQSLKLTNQGEIFSADWMLKLARGCKINSKILNEGLTNPSDILNFLTNKKAILVPYDADFNHSPCIKKGHKAHWALIFGFMAPHSFFKFSTSTFKINNCNLPSVGDTGLHILSNDVHEKLELVNLDKKNIFLLAKHGKSRHTAVWNYHDLKESNKNLTEIDPKRIDRNMYVLPENLNLSGLNNKAVLLEL